MGRHLDPPEDREYYGTVEIEVHIHVPDDEYVDAVLEYDLDYGEVSRVLEAHIYSAKDLAYLEACTHAGRVSLQEIAEQAFDDAAASDDC